MKVALKEMKQSLRGVCPVCEALVFAGEDVEESEILFCSDCQSMLVVDAVNGDGLLLQQAPEIEEDWGE